MDTQVTLDCNRSLFSWETLPLNDMLYEASKLTFGLLLPIFPHARAEGSSSEPPTSRGALQALLYAPFPLR